MLKVFEMLDHLVDAVEAKDMAACKDDWIGMCIFAKGADVVRA